MASQALNSSTQPTDVYGGDEVSAIILDPGYSSIRAGFAGEDAPKSFAPSDYGVTTEGTFLFGDDAIHDPNANLEIRNPMGKDGTVEDWDIATQLWEHAITSRLTNFKQADPRKNGLNDDLSDAVLEMETDGDKPLEEHPLLMTETAWNSTKNREKSIEVAMESWGCPAFWLARNSVLAAFGAGKATAMVIDVGASTASVVCVHDGLILKKSVQKSPLAGNWVSQQIRILFEKAEPKVNLVPHFMVAGKTAVDSGAPAQATVRNFKIPPTASFRALEEERIITEFKESVVQVWNGANGHLYQEISQGGYKNFDSLRSQPGRTYEMPDGSNQMWGAERYTVAEGMFVASNTNEQNAGPTLIDMIKASFNATDMDIRPHLLANVVVTGATTLMNGFVDRLNSEMTTMYPGVKVKIQAAGLTAERRFGSWMGGSVLGSLGTFHQMWISKAEYEEHGASIVEKRCK
ncbi:actin family [Calycina marina]|uniref:Actin family n=1 Tax=Calycina marina TaxID=1763456 RepID=A0A9P7YZJ4_9HELO|nr:actin family [Calycina marina]